MEKIFTVKKSQLNFTKFIFLILLCVNCGTYFSQATWTAIATQAPDSSGGLMLLLTDGSVLCKTKRGGGDIYGNAWNKLTPDINGSYLNGTWSTICPMNDTRLYFASQTMKNGKIYVAGGEYGSGGASGEVYDPVLNAWAPIPNAVSYMGDANSALLDNGKVMQGLLTGNFTQTKLYNPLTNAYSTGPTCIGGQDESTWLKLPDNSILTVDIGSTNAERYIPSLNQWIADATVPINLFDPIGFETGPGFLLPDGRGFFLGSPGNSAIYTPSGNNSPGSWVTGPSIPGGYGCPDAAGAMMVDGKIIFACSPVPSGTVTFFPPTKFYEYDYITNAFTQVSAPGGGQSVNVPCYKANMLDLPDGKVMMSFQGSKFFFFHQPNGAPLAAGKPTITTVTQNGCSNTFSLTGLLFNGICEGACYGDDWQMNTNFPIVRLTAGTNVYYARTYDWNRTGVQTGALLDTTFFSLPNNIPNGTYSLSVIANGNSSDPVTFTFSPFPALTGSLFMPDICTGSTFSYNAVANMTNTTMMWTRAAVAGITNTAIVTPQVINPNEVLTNSTTISKTVVYSYTLTNGSCVTNNFVSVVVNPNQPITINGLTNVCANKQSSLSATGINTFTWSTGAFTSSIIVSSSVATVYTVSGLNHFGCLCTKQITVNIKPTPTLNIAGTLTVCVGDSIVLTANSNALDYYWCTGDNATTLAITPTTTTTYSILVTYTNGCSVADSIKITVNACTGVKEIEANITRGLLYPNPFKDKLIFECVVKNEGAYDLKMYDVFGRSVKEERYNFVSGKNQKEFDFTDLINGVYMLIIQKDSEVFKTRLIKE